MRLMPMTCPDMIGGVVELGRMWLLTIVLYGMRCVHILCRTDERTRKHENTRDESN